MFWAILAGLLSFFVGGMLIGALSVLAKDRTWPSAAGWGFLICCVASLFLFGHVIAGAF